MNVDPAIERRFGTRSSQLALWQTHFVIDELSRRVPGLACNVQTFTTVGDDIVDRPLPELGGKGVFTARLEQALLNGDVDIAVHSLKDLPTETTPGLAIGAIMTRAEVRDALVTQDGRGLDALPRGATVGTSSLRRQAQLLRLRPDLTIKPIRGNVETRIKKVKSGAFAATILAGAGLERLGLDAHISEYLPLEKMLPAPGQGALAIQCRADDTETLEMLGLIDDATARAAVEAERAFLTGLGGGCAAPVAAYATAATDGALEMTGLVADPDGSRFVRVEGRGRDGVELARRLTQDALARGAGEILAAARGALDAKPPLRGRRIVVTRPADDNEELCTALSALGATPVRVPMIRIEPLLTRSDIETLLGNTRIGDWIVFTSANGVRAVATPVAVSAFAGRRIAAVGPSTAAALSDANLHADFVAKTFTGEALAREIPDPDGCRFWLFRAERAGNRIVDGLTARGAEVHDVAVYRTEPETIDAEGFSALDRRVDAIMFTSGSTARHFKSAWEGAGRSLDLLQGTLIVCIGPETAREAREQGFDVGLIARQHTTSGMVDALAEYFNEVSS